MSAITRARPAAEAARTETAVFANEAPPPNLKDLVPRIAPRPVLLIHAEKGVGGEELSAEYGDAAGEPTVVWKVPGAGHVGGIDARPAEYERRVVGFFDRALLGADRSPPAGGRRRPARRVLAPIDLRFEPLLERREIRP